MRQDSSYSKSLLSLASTYPISGWYGKRTVRISSLEHDSRTVKPGTCFVAFPGFHSDGQQFIADAERRGANAIICRQRPDHINPDLTYVIVRNPRHAFSKFSNAFWDNPSGSLFVIGISGTDGKSTTVQFLHQLLEACGHASGFLSTVARKSGDKTTLNAIHLSTPEAFELNQALAHMRESKKEFAVIEATSHALSKQTMRLESLHFRAALISNITHDHIDFHGSFAQYRSDKAELLRMLPNNAVAILNANDKHAAYCASQSPVNPQYFAFCPQNNTASTAEIDLVGTVIEDGLYAGSITLSYKGKDKHCTLPFAATLNGDNALAALLMASSILHTSPLELSEHLAKLSLPVGRMHHVPMQSAQKAPTILIDYAHTPAAFERLFPFVRANTKGKLIAVFGSAGERDVQKRPILGNIAGKYADIIILCDEDPRNEDSMAIIDDIALGLQDCDAVLHRIPDRPTAIEKALSLAKRNDTLLLLGKGHEQSILYNNRSMPWDEEKAVQELGNYYATQ